MADEGLIRAYVELVVGGARFEDERLVRLREAMSPAEGRRVGELLFAACVRTLPPGPAEGPEGFGSSAPEPRDFAGLYLRLVGSGARPDDVRLAVLADMMTPTELERAKAGIADLWLQAEPSGRPN